MDLQSYFSNISVPVFPLFLIILCLLIIHRIRLHQLNKREREHKDDFWERENKANAVRAVDLSTIDYITIPLETLPLHVTITDQTPGGDEEAEECARIIEAISEKKVKNLMGQTNTDLKLQYGPANLEFLSQCDDNFTVLITTLDRLAKRLYDLNLTYEAMVALQYAVSIGSDIRQTYQLLGDIYISKDYRESYEDLKQSAASLPSLNRDTILKNLEEAQTQFA